MSISVDTLFSSFQPQVKSQVVDTKPRAAAFRIKTKIFQENTPSYNNWYRGECDCPCKDSGDHLISNHFQEGEHVRWCPAVEGIPILPVDNDGASVFYTVKDGKIVHARFQQAHQSYEALVQSPGENDIIMAKPYASNNMDDGIRIRLTDVLQTVFSDIAPQTNKTS